MHNISDDVQHIYFLFIPFFCDMQLLQLSKNSKLSNLPKCVKKELGKGKLLW